MPHDKREVTGVIINAIFKYNSVVFAGYYCLNVKGL